MNKLMDEQEVEKCIAVKKKMLGHRVKLIKSANMPSASQHNSLTTLAKS